MADLKKQDYNLAFTHLKNDQNISAHNLFINLAESQKNQIVSKLQFFIFLQENAKQNKEKKITMRC